MLDFPSLKTDRLHLRAPLETDGPVVLMLRSDPVVNEFVKRPKPNNLDEALEFIDKLNSQFETDKSVYWVINLSPSDKMIGSICLWKFTEDRKKAELGYDLHPSFQNQGIMSEAIQAVLKYGFGELNLKTVDAFTQNDNLSSVALLKKNNFTLNEAISDPDNEKNIVFEIHR